MKSIDHHRAGILPLGDGDGGGRRDHRHQPVQPARRRSQQDQDARTDRRVSRKPARCRRKSRSFRRTAADLYTDEQNAAELRKAGADGTLGSWIKAHLGAHRQRRLCCAARLYRAQQAHISTRCRRCGWRSATRSMSRPAPASARASCIRPARPTRAGRTAACSCRSPRMTQKTSQVPGQKASFGVVKAAQARGDFDVLDRARPARAAGASQGRSRIGAEGARCARSPKRSILWKEKYECSSV